MNLIRISVRQPVTVTVGVVLVMLAGLLALGRVPIQLTPNVEDTIVAVTTRWEGASPEEVEQEIVDPQEERLQGIADLRSMRSSSQQGTGTIILEFNVGTSKESALREVSDKLRQVPSYPENVDEPVVEASDPENRDYIAWWVLSTDDPDFDIRTLQDFVEDRVKPSLERVAGVSEVNVLGGREREVQVRYDPLLLAQRGITAERLVDALRRTNRNVSAGEVAESKRDVRLRMVSQYGSVASVEATVVAHTPAGEVRVGDVAEVVETYKEPDSFVHSRGVPVIALNAQREVGANVIEVMDRLRERVAELHAEGGILDAQARELGLEGGLRIEHVYDVTVYIDDALALVEDNIWIGGSLALGVLLVFLGSIRSAAIVGLSIPISVVGAVVFMLSMGRSINVISLAGMAFAVGMVVDNAIVVLENVYRHLEMGKRPPQAALDGTHEVFGAVLASTLTTAIVFLPILLVEEEAGQLFRDIAIAVVAAVLLSMLVAVTIIPCASARLLRQDEGHRPKGRVRRAFGVLGAPFRAVPGGIARVVHAMNGSVVARVAVIVSMTALSIFGTWALMPPSDYLPQGNRNLVFGMIIPPPGYNLDQQLALAERIETTMRPYWEAARFERGSPEYAEAMAALPEVPTFDYAAGRPGPAVVPPPIANYFLVSMRGMMFHGAVATEPERAVDLQPLLQHATRAEEAPGTLAFAFQVPLFRLGGSTGSAVKINFAGDDLGEVTRAALASYLDLAPKYGFHTVQPDPNNFNLPGPELQVVPDLRRLAELGMSPAELGTAVRTLGDGAVVGDYRIGGRTIDLKVVAGPGDPARRELGALGQSLVAAPGGAVVPLGTVARLERVGSAAQINREGRQRAVTLQFTAPKGLPLEQAVAEVRDLLDRNRAAGVIPLGVETSYTGSASKLDAVKRSMLGDGTLVGTATSSLVLALLVCYLLMCVLFQSFLRPLIIMFSVPLATVGGFAGLRLVHDWSAGDRYMPVQNLDVLTMLGFVILIGIVVNNAILIVHQAINFMRGDTGDDAVRAEPLAPREAITESVRTRIRPIFMSTLTSVLGMLPLVVMPGSGSELYRGLGSVVLGGLIVSTIFTLFLVPALFSLATDLQARLGLLKEAAEARDPPRSAKRPAAAAAAMTLIALLFAAGCRQPPRTNEHLASRVAALNAEQLAAVPQDAPARAGEASPTGVEAELAARRDDLERLGGRSSYSALEPALGRDLLGQPQATRALGLREAVAAAAEHNLGVRLVRLEAASDAEEATVARAAFDAVFFAEASYDYVDEPNRVPVIGGIPLGRPESTSEADRFRAGLRKLLSNGATVSAGGFLERLENRTGGIEFDPDPAYTTGVELEARQPFLRGFGIELNAADLELAHNLRRRSGHRLAADLLLTLATTEQAYWDLVEAWARLQIQERLLAQGREVERVLGERRTFDTDPAEYSDALATVEQRAADAVRARRLLRRASDRLKELMNAPDLPLASEVLLRPVEPLDDAGELPALREALVTALERRPELESAILDIDDADIRERVARNHLLPQLDVTARLAMVGLDDSAHAAFGNVFEDEFASFFLGISLEVPIGNRAAEARFRQARLGVRRSLVAYERTLRDVVQEVKAALRDLEAALELVAATRSFRVAQSENLRALLAEEETRGRLTPEFLNLKFQRQERLARAQQDEVDALSTWNRALAAFHRAVGTGLRANRVRLENVSEE